MGIDNIQFKVNYNVIINIKDSRQAKYAIFVNIIHRLDALQLIIVTKFITNKNFIPLHDAYLFAHTFPIDELVMKVSQTFTDIHNNHYAFKSMFNRLAKRLGNDMTYEEIIELLALIPPMIKNTGKIINLS
jgi:hypothetical protein